MHRASSAEENCLSSQSALTGQFIRHICSISTNGKSPNQIAETPCIWESRCSKDHLLKFKRSIRNCWTTKIVKFMKNCSRDCQFSLCWWSNKNLLQTGFVAYHLEIWSRTYPNTDVEDHTGCQSCEEQKTKVPRSSIKLGNSGLGNIALSSEAQFKVTH